MSMRKTEFVTGEYYHVYNRGVDKRIIFKTKGDYRRFLFILGTFRDPDHNLYTIRHTNPSRNLVSTDVIQTPWVTIHAYCLMPNHYHLLVRQECDRGISEFMHRIGTGYTNYFNLRYDRSGRLFQNTFCAARVTNDRYFMHLVRYIHLNSLDLYESGWCDQGLHNRKRAWEFVEKYPWSSYREYLGEADGEIPSFLTKTFVESIMGSCQKHREFVCLWTLSDQEFLKPYLRQVIGA